MREQVDRRRTDTRRRVRVVALEMFTEQGYELTSLTQVAQKVGVTRQAVLHHFANKEELLTSSYEELLPVLDALIASAAASGPSTPETRMRVITEFDALVRGEHGGSLVCAQVNEHALRGLPAAQVMRRRLNELTRLLATEDSPEGRMRGRLACSAIVMAAARRRELGGTKAERHEAALATARALLAAE